MRLLAFWRTQILSLRRSLLEDMQLVVWYKLPIILTHLGSSTGNSHISLLGFSL